MRQGQLIDELIAAERLREAKELSRLSIRHFETRVLFLDFKTFVPRNTPRQKEYALRLSQRGVFRTREEGTERWANAPHGRRNRPGGAGSFCLGVIIGDGRVWVCAEVPKGYKSADLCTFLDDVVRPALEAGGIGRVFTLRTDRDRPLIAVATQPSLNRLPCKVQIAKGHQQALMPHDFSLWAEGDAGALEALWVLWVSLLPLAAQELMGALVGDAGALEALWVLWVSLLPLVAQELMGALVVRRSHRLCTSICVRTDGVPAGISLQ
uniref:Uncharacterized protein n=1 Tax=Chromera velia CCMP2878 TaxID=1169474 RepID=A0A0G4F8F4_9ALVE|eukprot:Cvel_15763.t1-p1 / transcript=Cvel_15763.t1 / gene=Cvel_15763 / organism=Chromera_velia_CCMP2878 / gene_product=hypothetical protein / transcript_product=hypothetical protein / location=Cvel_scaffold1181:20396-31517(+) / protein_length=266 / sequence_SO=supercontig / SO=protein_coding / is_pseudo=false